MISKLYFDYGFDLVFEHGFRKGRVHYISVMMHKGEQPYIQIYTVYKEYYDGKEQLC